MLILRNLLYTVTNTQQIKESRVFYAATIGLMIFSFFPLARAGQIFYLNKNVFSLGKIVASSLLWQSALTRHEQSIVLSWHE